MADDIKHIYILLNVYDENDRAYFDMIASMRIKLYIGDSVFMEYNIDPRPLQ